VRYIFPSRPSLTSRALTKLVRPGNERAEPDISLARARAWESQLGMTRTRAELYRAEPARLALPSLPTGTKFSFSFDSAMVSTSAHSPHYPECSTWPFPSPEHRKQFSLDFRRPYDEQRCSTHIRKSSKCNFRTIGRSPSESRSSPRS
jgi:hypothetical protein